jgi:mannosyltransferase
MNMLSIAGDTLDNLYHNATFARDDYRGIARVIMAQQRTGDAIILDAPNQIEAFSYYYKGDAPIYPLPAGLGGDDAATRAQVEDVIGKHRRIFVLYWGETERDPNRVVENTLNNRAFPAQSGYYGDVRLVIYAMPGAPPSAPDSAINRTFGDLITLEGAAINPRDPLRGDVTAITLFWRAEQTITKRYKVFLHLLDKDGRIAAQRDSEPGGGAALTTTWKPGERVIDPHGLVMNPTLAAGEYRLIVGLYDLDNATERLKVGESDFVELGTLTVR